ncbi:MAG: hypothetical protein INH41_23930 [Myxococcaceae bacterium]|nr:hypothetical protein [Myxococcaceae bacterium]
MSRPHPARWTSERLAAALGRDAPVLEALAARCPENPFGVDERRLVAALSAIDRDEARWLDLDVEGLVVATACVDGDPEALAWLDGSLLRNAVRSVSRSIPDADLLEVGQLLRSRLLVGTGEAPPKLALYSGRGSLPAFLRIVAANVALNARDPRGPAVTGTDELAFIADEVGLEATVSALDQQQQFKACFREAIARLTVRERTLLRLNLLDGRSIDELAPMYGAHRATVARWLAAAREALAASVKAMLGERLRLEPPEVERLLTSVQSRFELSLSSALRDADPPP